jgi:hypothetical protein
VPFAAEHCVSLASSRLTVGKEGGVMPIKDRFYKMRGTLIEFLLLSWVIDVVESKYLLLVVFPFDIY